MYVFIANIFGSLCYSVKLVDIMNISKIALILNVLALFSFAHHKSH
jgi:hypothetical protein